MTDAPPTADVPSLSALPDDARAWVYVTAEPLSDRAARGIEAGLAAFFGGWHSHGRTVRGGAEVRENRIVVVAAHVEGGDISGCGIDQHVRVLDHLLGEHGAALADVLAVVYRDRDGTLRTATRPEFRKMREAGAASGTLRRDAGTLGEVRSGLDVPLA